MKLRLKRVKHKDRTYIPNIQSPVEFLNMTVVVDGNFVATSKVAFVLSMTNLEEGDCHLTYIVIICEVGLDFSLKSQNSITNALIAVMENWNTILSNTHLFQASQRIHKLYLVKIY